MGIYISGVKGLPEQVQANKEDIKTIKEEIEGIDFEEIRQLEEQVGENTQDINNLEASIGVQNQAINGLKDRADALERTTQLMSYNDDLSMTDFRNSIEVADDVYARNVRVEGDGSIVNTTQSGFHFKEGANDDTLTIANNDGATPHYLHFNADGTLDIDGQAVGAKPLYQHRLVISVVGQGNYFNLILISEKSTALTLNELYTLLYNNGFRGNSSLYSVQDYIDIDLVNSTFKKMVGIMGQSNSVYARINNNGTTTNYTCTIDKDCVLPI